MQEGRNRGVERQETPKGLGTSLRRDTADAKLTSSRRGTCLNSFEVSLSGFVAPCS